MRASAKDRPTVGDVRCLVGLEVGSVEKRVGGRREAWKLGGGRREGGKARERKNGQLAEGR